LSEIILLSSTTEPAAGILPSLSLLGHAVTVAPAALASLTPVSGLAESPGYDVILVDARRDLVQVRDLLRGLDRHGVPVVAVIGEAAWAAVTADWGVDDVVLHTAGPGEVEARLRLAIGRYARSPADRDAQVRSGALVIDEATYSARIAGTPLDLTFKEFELLKFLAQHPRRVFTRSQLLQEVWGYDYFGGTRTVDVHVRRLRAKLGSEHEALIGTVRNVGYKFVPAKPDGRPQHRDATGHRDSTGHRDTSQRPDSSRRPDGRPARSADR
jgi:DNA-binding response OmpR family regulator